MASVPSDQHLLGYPPLPPSAFPLVRGLRYRPGYCVVCCPRCLIV